MANALCLKDTHLAVLMKKDFKTVMEAIEKKNLLEKISFLRSIPIFSRLTKTSLGKITYYFANKKAIKNQVIYKEGDPAEYVYIIQSGEI